MLAQFDYVKKSGETSSRLALFLDENTHGNIVAVDMTAFKNLEMEEVAYSEMESVLKTVANTGKVPQDYTHLMRSFIPEGIKGIKILSFKGVSDYES